MSAQPTPHHAAPRLLVSYQDTTPEAALARPDTLAVIAFGTQADDGIDDPRLLRVRLEPLGAAPLEVWTGRAPVTHGRDGDIAWSQDGALLFGAIELDEPDAHDGIASVAETVYQRLTAFVVARGYPHLLRVWNYFDDITQGEGDDERYRRFCVGRARALTDVDPTTLPAATAIGRATDAPRRLQVYWLAAREPGTPLENPRQVSAYRYPRRYGPQSPGFARAMLPMKGADMPLMLSGTAAIVGHESQHHDDIEAQLDEVLANLDSLVARARDLRQDVPASFGAHSPLKVYVRDREDMARVAELLSQRLPPQVPRIVLHAAVCRRELRVEIDGVHA